MQALDLRSLLAQIIQVAFGVRLVNSVQCSGFKVQWIGFDVFDSNLEP
jgi:hypothetical protein